MAGAARQWNDNSDVQGGGHGYAVSISGSALYAWNGDGIMHATWAAQGRRVVWRA